jgi:hypothetical protein
VIFQILIIECEATIRWPPTSGAPEMPFATEGHSNKG